MIGSQLQCAWMMLTLIAQVLLVVILCYVVVAGW